MKKIEYKAPEMEIIKLAAAKFLCGSDPTGDEIPTEKD
jgi:hypothetical protein